MPLVLIDLVRGRTPEEVRTLLNVVHRAMVKAFDVPETDRYQILTQHEPYELVLEDTGLGITRSEARLVIRFLSRERPPEAKAELFRLLAASLESECGIRSADVVVAIAENGPSDWSFGMGEAQFLTGPL
ncbi:tautomerase family protein [Paenarthrobacter sp. NPDC089316]|uniref:tautomerase family protein n=1 Tax=unclassified Paenarthrobacter TaxID=2634190 RepID=UPI003429F0B8